MTYYGRVWGALPLRPTILNFVRRAQFGLRSFAPEWPSSPISQPGPLTQVFINVGANNTLPRWTPGGPSSHTTPTGTASPTTIGEHTPL
ncbi:hypothetical protein F4774DRAFT_369832 [Daldinia eschscholtzii]|nr:hypothetical protein F4774DRAFT_369832 [Daldinia eschscholtzii]